MSRWTHIHGIIEVSPFGHTQAEKTYVLETILEHQPRVTGSEEDMSVRYMIKPGYNHWSSHDELGVYYGYPSYRKYDKEAGEGQDSYLVILDADLRDRTYRSTFKELINWLCRLSKRVMVDDILIKIIDEYGEEHIISESGYGGCFHEMFESPFRYSDKWEKIHGRKLNRFRYLCWEMDPYSGLPLSMLSDDYEDPEVDEELARRKEFEERRAEELRRARDERD